MIEWGTHHREGLDLAFAAYGDGRTFVFQHGLCGDAGQPADAFPMETGWRGVTLESRGHGRSPAGSFDAFSIAAFADDLIALIEARAEPPLPLGGISMGAAMALRIAVRRPDLVSALVLARPAWLDEAAPPNMRPNAVVGELLRTHPTEEAEAAFERSPLARQLAAEAPDNLASLRGFFARAPHDVTAELLCRIPADGPGVSRAEIAAIRVPTLVIGNTRDAVHPIGMAAELAGLIPGARLVRVTSKSDSRDGYRDEFRSALAAFLGDLP